jgi:hypothetical protein
MQHGNAWESLIYANHLFFLRDTTIHSSFEKLTAVHFEKGFLVGGDTK